MSLEKYKMPYPQGLLKDVYGLTSVDIAQALDMPLYQLNEKIRRPEFKAMCEANNWEYIATAIKSKSRGRPTKIFIMETNIAKALVATSASQKGWGYLKFLLDCEKVAMELMPKLINENELLKIRLKAAESKEYKRLPGPKTDAIPHPVAYAEDLFGEEQVIEVRWVKKKDLTDLELARAIKRHCLATGAGAIEKAKKLDEQADNADRKLHKRVKSLL